MIPPKYKKKESKLFALALDLFNNMQKGENYNRPYADDGRCTMHQDAYDCEQQPKYQTNRT